MPHDPAITRAVLEGQRQLDELLYHQVDCAVMSGYYRIVIADMGGGWRGVCVNDPEQGGDYHPFGYRYRLELEIRPGGASCHILSDPPHRRG